MTTAPLAPWNRDLEAGLRTLPDEAWDEWVWGCDLHAPLAPHFNRCHLLGLLMARYKALFHPAAMDLRLAALFPTIVHGSVMVADLSLRQLRDAAEDLQLHWAAYTEDWDGAITALDGLFARFGALCLTERQHDDLTALDAEAPLRVGRAALRRFTALFCVLYRHAHLATTALDATAPPAPNPHIQSYHVQAGLEAFYLHAMHADLPPAARILYKQDFAGMYHCVTQVVYYHYPSYERRRQKDLQAIREGASSVHALSAALELHPTIPVVMEDEPRPPGWHWVLLGSGRVYLIDPQRNAHAAACLWTLLRMAEGGEEGGG